MHKKIITTLWKSKGSELFHKPVDPLLLGLSDYFDVIKHPMDFSTIKKKLTNLTYTNFKEFTEDLNLVFDNCYKYNRIDNGRKYLYKNKKGIYSIVSTIRN